MRTIIDLYQSIDKPVYIFATGPSLLKINPDEYKDKLCFGINYSFQKMPYMDHIFIHELETYDIIQKIVDNNKLIIPFTLNKNKTSNHIAVNNDKAYRYNKVKYELYSNPNGYEISLDKEQWTNIYAYTTTTHSAIHIAAYMGATKIYLIGCDYRCFDNGKVHFETDIDDRYDKQDWQVFKKHKYGDDWIAQQLKTKYNIEVINLSN